VTKPTMCRLGNNPLVPVAICLLVAAAAPGCKPQDQFAIEGHELMAVPADAVSVYQLAGRLGMRVASSSRTCAKLTNGHVTVMIYADPDGQVLVNARPVGPAGGITPVGDTLFLPAAAVEPVRAAALAQWRRTSPPQPQFTRPQPAHPARLVCIDPGHGGKDPGALGCNGTMEKTVNLAVAAAVTEILTRRGARVVMTRTDDTFVELNERAAIANRNRVDLFVSIHADSCTNPSATGFTLYCSRSASGESLRAADALVRRMSACAADSRGVRRADFRVLVRTSCPAVLVELGYLSNHAEARKLSRLDYQRRLAEAIADGIGDFLR